MNHYHLTVQGWMTFESLYRFIVKLFPSGSHFVEVGSWFGMSTVFMAVEIINSGKNIKFDAVDNWKGSEVTRDPKSEWYEPLLETDGVYDKFLENIKPVGNIINPVRKESIIAAKDYKNKSLDFVFIDAGHSYVDVLNDIKAWFPKIKKGGIIAGHDYVDDEDVKRAVNVMFPDIINVMIIKSSTQLWGDCWMVIV